MNGDELVSVRLIGVPVPLWARSQEHTDELMREFMLIATDQERTKAHEVPARLVALVDELTSDYAEFGGENELLLASAAEGGLPSVDLDYALPAAVTDAVQRLDELLDEADEYCLQGEHLLTLATPEPLVRFRHWFLREIIGQIRGAAPVAWADYDGD